VYIRSFWQGNHQIYGHIWCNDTVLANPIFVVCRLWLRHRHNERVRRHKLNERVRPIEKFVRSCKLLKKEM